MSAAVQAFITVLYRGVCTSTAFYVYEALKVFFGGAWLQFDPYNEHHLFGRLSIFQCPERSLKNGQYKHALYRHLKS